ncbi:hypothetical protein BC834DRAFT_159463 [Gloeopeniophorella convolvens]|nr:hypothetical protein BC834DRAFT_159463 [Gloeopeniophorella convolvens]
MSAPKGVLLNADSIAQPFLAELRTALAARPPGARPPTLVGILATSSAPSAAYAEFTRRQCAALGVRFELRAVGRAVDPDAQDGDGAEEAIIEANADADVDGIMVYYPIFGRAQDHYLQQIVSPLKDVEGLHYTFHYNLYHNIRFIAPRELLAPAPAPARAHEGSASDAPPPPPGTAKSLLPCTPLGVVKALEAVGVYNALLPYGDRAYGRTVTVINRSEVVGRPLAALLANDGARVFSVDVDSVQEYTKRPAAAGTDADVAAERAYHPHHVVRATGLDLRACLALSDVVVAAVPSAGYKVPTAQLKDGCVCVNVAAEKNFEADVRDRAALYVPAVGKVTVLMLLRNLLRLMQYQELLREAEAAPAQDGAAP